MFSSSRTETRTPTAPCSRPCGPPVRLSVDLSTPGSPGRGSPTTFVLRRACFTGCSISRTVVLWHLIVSFLSRLTDAPRVDLPPSVYPSIADPGPLPPPRGCAWAAVRVRVRVSFQSLPHLCVRRGGIAGAHGDLESCSAVSTVAMPVYVWPGQEARPSRPRRHPPFPLLKTGGRSGVAGGVCLAPGPSFSID